MTASTNLIAQLLSRARIMTQRKWIEAATGGARRLLARSRLPPIRGYTPSAPRYGLRGVGCLKQMTNAVFQQFDGTLQGAELSKPHYRDGHVQVK
jgi:hypothetical protein